MDAFCKFPITYSATTSSVRGWKHCHCVCRRHANRCRYIYPLFHCCQLLSILFFITFVFLWMVCPFFTFHQALPISSVYTTGVFPTSQVCPSLDGNFSLLFTSFNPSTPSHLHSKRVRFSHRFLIMLLLILSGNVEPNPGPVVISSNIEFACLNIRSALATSVILEALLTA